MNLNDSNQGTIVWPEELDTEEKVMEQLKKTPSLYGSYRRLNGEWRQRFLDFCQGKKSLPLTYDPFFKRIFHPDIHPDRLSRLVSSLLGIEVKVVRILPNEDSLMDGDTLLIMDLFPRATSQADMLACPFGDCREGQIPRSSAVQQV